MLSYLINLKNSWILRVQRLLNAKNLIIKYFPESSLPRERDVACISNRQLESPVTDVIAVHKSRCRYGFPQAMVRYPVGRKYDGSLKVDSGMIRLTCPHLVKAVDKYEAEGGIEFLNKKLLCDVSLQENFRQTNMTWYLIRLESMNEDDEREVAAKLGDKATSFFRSGIIGISLDKEEDVKCLHAHVADFIIRGRNRIGEITLDELKQEGIDSDGCAACWQQCSERITKEEAKWWYVPRKNKLGKRPKRTITDAQEGGS